MHDTCQVPASSHTPPPSYEVASSQNEPAKPAPTHHGESADLGLMSAPACSTTLVPPQAPASTETSTSATTSKPLTTAGSTTTPGRRPGMVPRLVLSRRRALLNLLCCIACCAAVCTGFALLVKKLQRGVYKFDESKRPWYCDAQKYPGPVLDAYRQHDCDDGLLWVHDTDKEVGYIFALLALFGVAGVFALAALIMLVEACDANKWAGTKTVWEPRSDVESRGRQST